MGRHVRLQLPVGGDNLPSEGRFVLFSYLEESTVAGVAAVGGTDAAVDPEAAAAVDDASKEVAA